MIIIPSSDINSFKPSTKSFILGVWAKVLVDIMKSALPYLFFIFFASLWEKNSLIVLMPFLLAMSDKFFAGSTPRIFLEKLEADSKKVPSFEPISKIKESLLILNFRLKFSLN